MNLSELYNVLKNIDESALSLGFKVYYNPTQNENRYEITGIKNLKYYIDVIGKTRLFDNIIGSLKHSYIYSTDIYIENDDKIDLNTAGGEKLMELIFEFRSTVITFKNYLKNTITEGDSSALNIKLPPADDFEELEKVMNELKRAISIPLKLQEINGDVKILRGEPGSIWLVVQIIGEGLIALNFIAALCWAGAVIRKKILEGNFLEQQIRDYEIGNNFREELNALITKGVKAVIDTEANAVLTNFDISDSQQNREILKLSLNSFSDLHGKGAEFRPSLSMPENVSNLFPTKEQMPMIESKIKQLGENGAAE